jgi:hypothetical protein
MKSAGSLAVGHHTTLPHSVNKIEKMRRTDEALNCTIRGLVEAIVAKT